MRVLEEELEFFGFNPSEYHQELQLKVSSLLDKAILSNATDRPKVIDKLESAVERNMLIFERYTLRNIFSFPEGFFYERRITDRSTPSKEEVKKKMLSLAEIKERESMIKERIEKKKGIAKEMEQRLKEVEELPFLDKISKGVEEIGALVRKIREIKRKYSWSSKAKTEPKKALENEIRKRECHDLEKRVPIEILSRLERILSAQEERME